MIATEAHRRAFGRQLAAVGVDLEAVGAQRLVWLDAAEVLARFTSAGGIDAEAFYREVGSVITSAAETGRPVCVYGEMVQLLWDAGVVVAVLELERLWNEVIAEHRCMLMCAYRSSSVLGAQDGEALRRVCGLHSAVLHAPAGEVRQSAHGQSLRREVLAPVPDSSRQPGSPAWRSELSALYRQVANTLEQSAGLAERHAEREDRTSHRRSAEIELERATRAREAAQRARDLASRTR